MASTAVIFSLGGCFSKKKSKKVSPQLVIGAPFSLLTLDPFSFQALGDGPVYRLIYDFPLVLSGYSFKESPASIKWKEGNLFLSDGNFEFKEYARGILRGKESVLWSKAFSNIEFNVSESSLSFSHFDDLRIVSSYLFFDGKNRGPYRVGKFLKGAFLELVKNPHWYGENSEFPESIKLVRVKSPDQGLKLLKSGKLDLYFPRSYLHGKTLAAYPLIKPHVFADKSFVFGLYYNQEREQPCLSSSLENIKETLKRIFGEGWRVNFDPENQPTRSKVCRNLAALVNFKEGERILDILAQDYRQKLGFELTYENPSSIDLTKRLKKGSFDLYLSLDLEDNDQVIPYESFHSRGKYNSLRVSDSRVDRLLENRKAQGSLGTKKEINEELKDLINEVKPMFFESSSPAIEYLQRSSQSYKRLPHQSGLVFKKVL